MKLENWPEKLTEYLDAPHSFDWTTCNCALFAADAVMVQTGEDFAKDYRGPKTKRGMVTRLLRVCCGDVEAAVTKELGNPIEHLLKAQRGDVVSYDFGDGPALGICNGSICFFIHEKDGLVRVPLTECRKAWRVE